MYFNPVMLIRFPLYFVSKKYSVVHSVYYNSDQKNKNVSRFIVVLWSKICFCLGGGSFLKIKKTVLRAILGSGGHLAMLLLSGYF